jgi:lipopolysaccharide export system protein LptA
MKSPGTLAATLPRICCRWQHAQAMPHERPELSHSPASRSRRRIQLLARNVKLAATASLLLASMPLGAESSLPLNISADSVEHDDAAAVLTYSGNVKLTQGEVSLYCDSLQLSRGEQQNSLVTAVGSPVVAEQSGSSGSSRVEAATATYAVQQRLLQVHGKPLKFRHLDPQGNTTSGNADEAEYDMRKQHITMKGAPIHITHSKKGGGREPPLIARARQADYDLKQEQIIMSGDARIEQDDSKVSSERIIFDLKRMSVVAGRKAQAAERVHTTIHLDKK